MTLLRRLTKLERGGGTDLSRLSDEALEARLRDVDARIRKAGVDLGFVLPADLCTATDQWWRDTFSSLKEHPL